MKRYLLAVLLLIAGLSLFAQQIPLPLLWKDLTFMDGTDCVIQDDLLYMTNSYNANFDGPGLDLAILDLSASQRFKILGTLDLDAPAASRLTVHADRAIVIHTDGRLSAIDISNPSQPLFVTSTLSPAAIIAWESYGHYLYLYDSQGYMRCYAMDALDLVASSWIGTYYTAMTIESGRIYLSGTMPGFRCLGIDQPSAITDLGTLGNASNQQIMESGSGVLICMSSDSSLNLYDISSVGNCSLIQTWPAMNADYIRIDVAGGLMAVYTLRSHTDYNECSLKICDLEAAGGPQVIYTDDNPGSLSWLCISPDYLLHLFEYFGNGYTYSLYDLSTPSQPQFLDKLLTGGVYYLATNSNRLFANVGKQGLNIYACSETGAVVQTRLAEPSISYVAANEQHLLLNRVWYWGPGEPTSNAIYIYNILANDEYMPVDYSGGCSLGEPINDVLYQNDRLYMCGMGGLAIYDLTDTSHPVELAYLPGNYDHLEVQGNYLYLAGYDNAFKLWIYDISTPYSPQQLSWLAINLPDYGALRYHNNLLFVGRQPLVVDVSDPSIPEVLYQYSSIVGSVNRMEVAANALIVMRWNDLRIFDISSIANPQLVSSTSFDTDANCMTVKDGLAYIGHKEGLSCYDLRDALAYCAALSTPDDNNQVVPALSVYPNPMRDSSIMKLELPEAGDYSIGIYNLKGQLVKRFPCQAYPAGSNTLTWTGLNDQGVKLPSGVYLLRASSPSRTIQAKVILLK